MTVEWIEYLAKKTPLEEKIDALSDSFEKIVDIFVKMAESFDQKVSGLNQKIMMLLDKMQQMYGDMNSLQQDKNNTSEHSVVLPPPANPPKINREINKNPSKMSDRRELIDELEKFFEKSKGKDKK